MVPTKAIVAAAFVAGAGGTSVYLLQPKAAAVVRDVMPEWRSVENSTDTETYTSKFGEDYVKLLVGTGNAKTNKTPASNDDWWNWVFKTRYEPANGEAKGGFKDITRGAKGTTTGNSLEEACKTAYNSESDKVKSGELSSGDAANSEFKEDQLWKFCSPLGKKPKTLNDVASLEGDDKTNLNTTSGIWNGKVGGNNKTDLLAVHHTDNEEVWKLLDKDFQANKTTSGYFHTQSTNNKKVKEICKDAYALDTTAESSSDKPSDTDLYKWCSLKGRKVN